jgi:hypothetical protein
MLPPGSHTYAVSNPAFATNNENGASNTALGTAALRDNVSGSNNQAVGRGALRRSTGNNNIAIGREAGAEITTVSNDIIIGQLSGVHSVFGQASNRCFIDNIYGKPVSSQTWRYVLVDSDGRLGTFITSVDAGDSSAAPQGRRQVVPEGTEPQAMLNRKVEKLQVTVAQQQEQIRALIAQLKEQAAQIQKVSAQLEVSQTGPRMARQESVELPELRQ